MASSSVKDKIKQTNIERYGCQNVFANEDIKKKIRQTWIKNYGTDHPMKNLNMRKNRDDLLELKYGVRNPYKLQSVRINCLKSITRVSKLQLYIKSLLLQNHIEFQQQFPILSYFYDFRIGKLLIEVNGDYWHANPQVYNQGLEINYPGRGYMKVSEVWKRDAVKREVALNLGFKVLYIWELDIKTRGEDWILNKIRKEL